jgi:hypothetical protein
MTGKSWTGTIAELPSRTLVRTGGGELVEVAAIGDDALRGHVRQAEAPATAGIAGSGGISQQCRVSRGTIRTKVYSAEAMPCRMAYAVRAASVWIPSFSVIFCLWNSTVLTETPRSCAISLRTRPSASNWSTSR